MISEERARQIFKSFGQSKMVGINSDVEFIPPGQSRVPVVDQAMELAKMMESHCAPEEVSKLLVSAARTWELTTTFVVKRDSP